MKTLLDLLPASPNAMLKTPEEKVKFLKMYAYFVKLAIESFETFLKGDLQKFDAHVGDTACQIRAYRVLKLYHFSTTRARLPSVIVTFQKMLDVLDTLIVEFFATKQKAYISRKDFLDVLKIEMSLDEDLVFLIAAFFLKKYSVIDDEIRIMGRIEHEKMQQELSFATKTALCRFVAILQRFLVQDSYDFLESLTIINEKLHRVSALLANTLLYDDVGRALVPIFVSNYIIFTDILSSRINVKLICKTQSGKYASLIFRADPSGTAFNVSDKAQEDGPCLVIKGEASRLNKKEEVLYYINQAGGLFELLLATVAVHPQFSGQRFTAYNADFFNFLFNQSSDFLFKDSIVWFADLYTKMLSLGKQFFETEQGYYFLTRHIYSAQC